MLIFSERLALLRCFEKEAKKAKLDEKDPSHLIIYLNTLSLLDEDKVREFLSTKNIKELVKHVEKTDR